MGLRVLVADDEADILEVLQDRLEAIGFTVVTAQTGLEALRKITSDRFDGIFLDVKMPEMSGVEVLEEVRKRDIKIPIIIITSSTSREVAVESIAKGADAYILKPFEWEELKEKIENAFNTRLKG
jgi:two-component system response regulator AtoC